MPHQGCDKGKEIDKIKDDLRDGRVLFTEIHADIKEMKHDLSEVKTQTFKTNGRVTKLERIKTNFMYLMIGVALCSADGPSIFKAVLGLIK